MIKRPLFKRESKGEARMNHSDSIVHFCDEILNQKFCSELARKHKFIQRSTSKLQGYEFVKAMIIPSEGLSMDSLEGLCKRIKEFNSEADLTPQALCERINDQSAKVFMAAVFSTLLCYCHQKIINKCPKLEKVLGFFNAILLEDSTVAKLNEQLQKHFEGTSRGGTGPKSQAKIDLIYDLFKGLTVDANIYRGKEPDQSLANRIIQFAKKGDLIIRDLGYFKLGSLMKIKETGAYFLSRFQPNVKIFLKKDDLYPVNLGKYIDKHFPNAVVIDLGEVFLGDEKVSSRMVIYRQPEEVFNKKLRDANKRSKDTGRKISDGKKLCLKYAIFVTSASQELIPAKIIGTIYRLRWEVELIFKRWKSQLQIDYLKGIDENRIECLIWSRLCTVIITEMIGGYIARIAEKLALGQEISHKKIIDYLMRENKFREAIRENRLEQFLKEMEEDIPRMLLKDKKKLKTMRERVFQCESYYDLQVIEAQYVA